jgi:hypothetical protein
MKKNKLIIISIPFQRLIRSHMNPLFIDILINNGDVLIVSPFADNAFFQKQYKKQGVEIIKPPSLDDYPKHKYFNILWNITEILRRQGFYRINKETPYNWATRHKIFGENGNDRQFNFIKKILINILGLVGSLSNSWRVFDTLHGYITYSFKDLHQHTKQYDKVVYISACCWGFQDALLSFWARKKKWHNILIPYSTDQLYSNGWLFCDFNKICIQGESEYKFAKKFHKIEDCKLIKLGSSNAFNIRSIMQSNSIVKTPVSKNSIQILFAGSSPIFFPTESEFKLLEFILANQNKFLIQNIFFTYRPLTLNKFEREEIANRFAHYPNLKIEYANPATFGLNKFEEINYEEIIYNHVRDLIDFDIMTMVGLTSLALDMALFDTPSIALFYDPSGVMEKREAFKNFNEKGEFIGFECYPIAHSEKDLFNMLLNLIHNPDRRSTIVNEINNAWDYNTDNYLKVLENLISNN